MVKRFINALRRRTALPGGKIPSSQRILILVCHHPELGHVTLEPADNELFVVEFDGATKVTAREILRKVFPNISLSDVHVYPEFSTDRQRYQPTQFDWPVLPEMFNGQEMEKRGWKFVPLIQHPETAKIQAKLHLALLEEIADQAIIAA